MRSSLPLGVDILEWKKARDFYRAHRDRLDALFSRREKNFILKSKKPSEAFAMIFCAKEAVFKATRGVWMGAHGFRKISLTRRRSGLFSFRARPRAQELVITFLKKKRHLVALCHPKEMN